MFESGNEEIRSEKDMGGYMLREIATDFGLSKGDEPAVMLSAFGKIDDCYIGDEQTAERLMEKGIAPECASKGDSVCSIGFSEKDGKYYGWSHRAIKGFGVGDETETSSPWGVTKGAKIKTLEEAKKAAIAFADSVS